MTSEGIDPFERAPDRPFDRTPGDRIRVLGRPSGGLGGGFVFRGRLGLTPPAAVFFPVFLRFHVEQEPDSWYNLRNTPVPAAGPPRPQIFIINSLIFMLL